jgi:hypothetical protein
VAVVRLEEEEEGRGPVVGDSGFSLGCLTKVTRERDIRFAMLR